MDRRSFVEFLVHSGSSVTAVSNSFYQTRVRAGAPLRVWRPTARKLRSANGTGIGVSGCSHCVVSFMGLQVEFPILVCNLATGTDAIIGTDVLGSVLPHTLNIKNGLLFTEGGFSPTTPLRLCSIWSCFYSGPLLDTTLFRGCAALFCTDYRWSSDAMQRPIRGTNIVCRAYRSDCGQNPSRWKVPVLVSNFSQDTVVVAPFSEVGMIAQVSAIQSIAEPLHRPQVDADSLPAHLRDLLKYLGILTLHNSIVWRMFYCNIRTCFLPRGRLSPVILMRWNTKLTLVLVRPYAVHLVGCPLRRCKRKRNVLLRC